VLVTYGYARIRADNANCCIRIRVVSGQNWHHLVASVKGVELLRIRLRWSRIEPKETTALAGILGVSLGCHTAQPPCGHRQGTAASREQHVHTRPSVLELLLLLRPARYE